MAGHPRFQVFVAGGSWRSQQVVSALHELCAANGVAEYTVEVVDVSREPALAEHHRVLAIPMVMRVAPPPVVRVTGDLSDAATAAAVLGLTRPPASDPSDRMEGSAR